MLQDLERVGYKAKKSQKHAYSRVHHRQPKLNIREPLNYKDLYWNKTDLCEMVETNIVLIAELIVCLTIESHRCGSRRFDRYTAGLHQAMVSTECVTV